MAVAHRRYEPQPGMVPPMIQRWRMVRNVSVAALAFNVITTCAELADAYTASR